MKQGLFLLIIASLLLNACTIIKPKQAAPSAELPDDSLEKLPDNPLTVAKQLSSEGRLGEAVTLLERGIAKGLGNEEYLATLSKVVLRKKSLEDKLQAQLLVEETRTLQRQLPILNRLAHTDPFDQDVAEKLLSVRSGLILNRKALSECGWKQAEYHSDIAVQCLQLALSIETNEEDQSLLEQLTVKQAKTIQKEVEKQQGLKKKQSEDRNQGRLQQAREYFQNGQFNDARNQLKLVLREDPDNDTAKKLLSTVKERLEAYLDSLLKTGDSLYREGEIEGAKAIWQAALKLDPHDTRAKEKIERADRVLKNLESLRQTN